MIQDYLSFFAVSAQTSATLVGLLFVALSIEVGLERESRIKQFSLSETAFISLGGILIISLLALLPFGIMFAAFASVILSIVGIGGLLRIHRYFAHEHLPIDVWYIFVTLGIYVLLAGTAIWILLTNGTVALLDTFCVLIVFLFGLSLIRAWRALLIIRRHRSS